MSAERNTKPETDQQEKLPFGRAQFGIGVPVCTGQKSRTEPGGIKVHVGMVCLNDIPDIPKEKIPHIVTYERKDKSGR